MGNSESYNTISDTPFNAIINEHLGSKDCEHQTMIELIKSLDEIIAHKECFINEWGIKTLRKIKNKELIRYSVKPHSKGKVINIHYTYNEFCDSIDTKSIIIFDVVKYNNKHARK